MKKPIKINRNWSVIKDDDGNDIYIDIYHDSCVNSLRPYDLHFGYAGYYCISDGELSKIYATRACGTCQQKPSKAARNKIEFLFNL